MSLQQQEQVMLALLFDESFRDAFCSNKTQALARFPLSDEEKNDFFCIKNAGLQFDAQLRIDLILSQLTRHFPLTFTLLSSFSGGMQHLKKIINVAYIQQKPADRAVYIARQIASFFSQCPFASQQDYDACTGIFHSEQQRAILIRQLTVAETVPPLSAYMPLPLLWQQQKITLANYVSAVVLPMPYESLKAQLAIEPVCDLWQRMKEKPLTPSARQSMWQQADARVFISQAYVACHSSCERVIDFKTAEVSEGFAPLFNYINGEYTVDYILQQLALAGANTAMVKGIESSFKTLLENGYFCLPNPEYA
jgi:hypothetical protein